MVNFILGQLNIYMKGLLHIVNYQTLYDKLRRENIILVNNYRIEYHKLDDVANHS